ncbi:hypothetical protein [Agromyces soli]|uniref:hypothetical protein n=1 Tax=Agromyces soli TaxID=659012 RepID=UPI0031E347D6
MSSAELEARFRAAMSAVAEAVLNRGARRTYDIVMDGAGQFIDEYFDCAHSGAAYRLWMEIGDLADDPRGPLSERMTDEIGRKAASEWLAIDQSSPLAVDAYFARWGWPEAWRAKG